MNWPAQMQLRDGLIEVGAHPFERLRRWFNRGRCRFCVLDEKHHPTTGWQVARPARDSTLGVDPDVR